MKKAASPTEGIYRRVSVRMYGDRKFMNLSPVQASGQSLFLYALTGPHTGPIPGVFVIGKAAMAESLGWEAEAFEKAFAEVFGEGLVEFDEKTRLWFIPNAIKHNAPANPNVVRSWRGPWSLLPECPARDRIAERLFTSVNAVSEAFGKAFEEASGKAFAKPSPKALAKQEAVNSEQRTGLVPPEAPSGRTPAKRRASTRVSEYSPRFESVWAIYPNGAGKGAASKAFEALVPDDALTAQIVAAIKAQLVWPAWLKDGGAFIPHFSTWLSRRQWEDRAPTPQVSALSAAASDWTCTRSGIEAKGVELGLGRWDQPAFEAGRGGETFQRYEARVRAAAAQREDCPA